MYGIAFGCDLQHARRGGAVLRLVELLAETLARLVDLLLDFLVLAGEPILDEHVGAVTLLGILVVDQRVVESPHMPRSLPRTRVHENRGVDAHDILVEPDHRIPPVALDVVFQLDPVLPVIVHGRKAVVDFARREDETVLLAMGHQFLEKFFLRHRISFYLLLLLFRETKVQNSGDNDGLRHNYFIAASRPDDESG